MGRRCLFFRVLSSARVVSAETETFEAGNEEGCGSHGAEKSGEKGESFRRLGKGKVREEQMIFEGIASSRLYCHRSSFDSRAIFRLACEIPGTFHIRHQHHTILRIIIIISSPPSDGRRPRLTAWSAHSHRSLRHISLRHSPFAPGKFVQSCKFILRKRLVNE